tara:strand:- start:573 stop:809 length:237 start_codon:yes stop_codon:yes gene_type:complete
MTRKEYLSYLSSQIEDLREDYRQVLREWRARDGAWVTGATARRLAGNHFPGSLRECGETEIVARAWVRALRDAMAAAA